MRISTSTLFDMGVTSIQQQNSALVKTQQQIATGRRILTPADDPIASARVLEVTQSKDLTQQYDVNTNSATNVLGLEDAVLGGVTSLMQDVHTAIITAQGPLMDHGTLSGLAADLRGRYQELLGLANSKDGNGQYMFSGYKGLVQPFSQSALGDVQYVGDQGQRLIQIAPSRQIAVGDAGSDVFQQIKNGNGTFVTAVGGNPGAPAVTPNLGTGVISSGSVLDPAKWAAAADKNLTIQFTGTPATNYTVTDTSGTVATGTFTSGSTIDLSATYGIQFSINGAPANGDTFTVKPSTNESVFATLGNLINALEKNPVNQTELLNNLNTALAGVENGLQRVLTVRASVGSRMNEIESVKNTGRDMALQYEQTLSGLQDLDYSKAITDLNLQQVGLEAAQKSFLKIQGLSLFNFLN